MKYSKEKWFCNNCGTELYTDLINSPYGRDWKTCSKECYEEIELKRSNSLLEEQEQKNKRKLINPFKIGNFSTKQNKKAIKSIKRKFK